MEPVTILFDVLNLFLALWLLFLVKDYIGLIGKSFRLIALGTIVIGLSQVFETVGVHFSLFDISFLQFTNRSLIFLGIIAIAWGVQCLIKKSDAK